MESVDVIVGYFGDRSYWGHLAARAGRSIKRQSAVCGFIPSYHQDSLAQARNLGAEESEADWLIFCDADDELDEHYVEQMLQVGQADLRWPSTIGIYEDGSVDVAPVLLQPKGPLLQHNWMVIATMMRHELFNYVGGFRELPILEDWDIFLRMALGGAKATPVEQAIYRIHVREHSRNRQGDNVHGWVYNQIQERYRNEWNVLFGTNEQMPIL